MRNFFTALLIMIFTATSVMAIDTPVEPTPAPTPETSTDSSGGGGDNMNGIIGAVVVIGLIAILANRNRQTGGNCPAITDQTYYGEKATVMEVPDPC